MSSSAPKVRIPKRVKTPTILQLEAVECGAAALAMVLASYRLWVPLDELRVACGVSRDGSRAGNIVRAARRYGMTAKGFRFDLDRLRGVPVPAIVFINMNHFVVLEGFAGGKVYVNDPGGGRRVLPEAEFDRYYSGIVLTFEPTPEFKPGGEPPKVRERLLAWLDGAHPAMMLAILAGGCLVLPGVVVPSFSRTFIDQYLIDKQDDWVPWLLAAMAVTGLVQGVLLWLQRGLLLRLHTRLAIRAAGRFVWQMLRLPVSFYAQRFAGGIGARSELAPMLASHAADQVAGIVVAAFSLLFFAAVMIGYSPLLTAVAVGCAALNLGLVLFSAKRIEELQQKATLDQIKLEGKTMQGLQMVESLKANGTDGAFFEMWSGHLAAVANQQQKIGRSSAWFTILPQFLGEIGILSVLLVGGWMVMQGELSIGMLIAFQMIQAAFAGPVQTLMTNTLALQGARGVLNQFDDVLLHPQSAEFGPPPVPSAPKPAASSPYRLNGNLTLRDLSFGYSPLEGPLIEKFDLDLVAGARVALVGASGSGKSTVGKLVTGLFEPWGGTICFDGVPIAEVPRPLLRNSLAVVDQGIVLFEGTVRDNITLWDDTMPESRVVRAAKDALIHDVIISRSGGYDAHVEEGGRNFSGGQRQRLEIARALVAEPTLLVLDEATSALDPVAEKEVMDNLRRRGCTCLIIAHRLSTIRDADEIIVMHRGKILQRGTHDALIAVDGPYRKLVEA